MLNMAIFFSISLTGSSWISLGKRLFYVPSLAEIIPRPKQTLRNERRRCLNAMKLEEAGRGLFIQVQRNRDVEKGYFTHIPALFEARVPVHAE